MAVSETELYPRFIRRVTWLILILGLTGSAYLAARRGLQTGMSFLIGASVSYLSFWRWQQLAQALTAQAKARRHWFFIVRFLLLGALAWAIIKYLGLNVAAAAAGLLVSAAAVILEVIYELIYAS
jgi:hypothetical protein